MGQKRPYTYLQLRHFRHISPLQHGALETLRDAARGDLRGRSLGPCFAAGAIAYFRRGLSITRVAEHELIRLPAQERRYVEEILCFAFRPQAVAHGALTLHGRLVQHGVVGRGQR